MLITIEKSILRFTKEDRSTFSYWFAHWCAFQMVALNMGIWKFKYLFHDIEKPWLKLFWPYKKVQKWHNEHNTHHLIYMLKYPNRLLNIDWDAMFIDWECGRYTKEQCPRNAADEYTRIFEEIETFIKTYRPVDNKFCNYIKENNIATDIAAVRALYGYIKMHETMVKLNIEHQYRNDYLQEYFDKKC